MSKPIEIRFWDNEIKIILTILQQAILSDADYLMNYVDHPETEEFCTILSGLEKRRSVYAKIYERFKELTETGESE